MSRFNGLGWVMDDNGFGIRAEQQHDNGISLEGRVELVCMRQIAHEVMETLKQKNIPWLEI